MGSLSFDQLVESYDKTRGFDNDCFTSALDFLSEQFPSTLYPKVFEPGIGTGRIAIPLAGRGYEISGIDISAEMLALLKKHLNSIDLSSQVSYEIGDTTHLPFPDSTFDIAIAVHLFYFIHEWEKAADELLRVVKPQGSIVLMHTGMGAEVPSLNARYKELCADQGCVIESVGVKGTGEVVDYYSEIGCSVAWIKDRWKWVSHITLEEAIHYIETRSYSFTTVASDEIHDTAVERLKSEMTSRFCTLDHQVDTPNQIYFVFIRRE
ncbi:MAG: class I SAM-dependent methyltransferase [Anaerolineae bacterium]|jgi:ubiquinone/menaquinone biosynthesis C-methylase UbiE|nr:class I SAM-dependent methyltransferase [Anaerolineae bacterium]